MSWQPAPPGPVRQRYEQVAYRSDLLYEFRARDGLVRDLSNEYPVRSGQGMVWTRGATASVTDSNGDSITIPANIPALSITDGEVGWKLGSDDLLWCEWNAGFQEMSGVLEFVQVGAMATSDDGVWHIGAAGDGGVRMEITSNGTSYRIVLWHPPTSSVSFSTGAPASDGDVVRLRWRLRNTSGSNYVVNLWQSVNGAAETVGTEEGSAVDLSAGWDANTRHYIGSTGGNDKAPLELRKDLIAADLDYDWSHE